MVFWQGVLCLRICAPFDRKCIGSVWQSDIHKFEKTIRPQESLKKHGKVPRVVQKKRTAHDVTTPESTTPSKLRGC